MSIERSVLTKLVGGAQNLLERFELAHGDCDIDSTTACKAVGYGDGNAAEHEIIGSLEEALRTARAVLSQGKEG